MQAARALSPLLHPSINIARLFTFGDGDDRAGERSPLAGEKRRSGRRDAEISRRGRIDGGSKDGREGERFNFGERTDRRGSERDVQTRAFSLSLYVNGRL